MSAPNILLAPYWHPGTLGSWHFTWLLGTLSEKKRDYVGKIPKWRTPPPSLGIFTFFWLLDCCIDQDHGRKSCLEGSRHYLFKIDISPRKICLKSQFLQINEQMKPKTCFLHDIRSTVSTRSRRGGPSTDLVSARESQTGPEKEPDKYTKRQKHKKTKKCWIELLLHKEAVRNLIYSLLVIT